MKFLIAFGTDNGKNLNNGHVGMVKYFYVYEFSNGKEGLIERRKNVQFKGDESVHGDPEKAKVTSAKSNTMPMFKGITWLASHSWIYQRSHPLLYQSRKYWQMPVK